MEKDRMMLPARFDTPENLLRPSSSHSFAFYSVAGCYLKIQSTKEKRDEKKKGRKGQKVERRRRVEVGRVTRTK